MTPKPILAFVAVTLAACAAGNSMPEPPEGAQLFAQNCAVCHGADAMGGAAGTLGKTPPDLTRIAARNDGVFPVAAVLSEIDGYTKDAHPERIMPQFGESLTGETVPVDVEGTLTPTPRPLAALLVYLQAIQQE
jgi:cytochrome c553